MAEDDDVVCNCVLMLVVQHTPSVQATPLFSPNRSNRVVGYSQRELGIWRFRNHAAAVKGHGPTDKTLLLSDSSREGAACYDIKRTTGHNSSGNPKTPEIDFSPRSFCQTQV
jgi:hypothetical protein